MALYSASSLKTVSLFYRGRAFIKIEASAAANTQVIDAPKRSYLTFFGFFSAALGPAVAAPVNNIYVKINGSWTLISQAYVYINNAWRDVVSDKFFVKIGGGWKS